MTYRAGASKQKQALHCGKRVALSFASDTARTVAAAVSV